MSAEYIHVGIPVTTLKDGMTYNEDMKLWMSNPDDYDMKIEYLKFEEGTPFPEAVCNNPHVAYKVDDADKYMERAEEILFGPVDLGNGIRIAFIKMDNTIIELYENKN